jgi:hypothetical protein
MGRDQAFVESMKDGFEATRYLDTLASRAIRYFDTPAKSTADQVKNYPSIIRHSELSTR